MPIMPNVVGRGLWEAQAELETAGVLVLANIGYFDIYPISASWVGRGANPPGVVTAQSIGSGSQVAVNAPITLTVTNYPMGVSFP